MSPFRSVPAALLVLAGAVAHPVATSAPCPTPEPAITARPEGVRLDDYVTRLARLGVFSGAVLVARHDTILLHGGYGLADQRACIPITRSTAFDIGSVAKTFMAAAVLRLEMEGRLRVGDSLTTFFPEAPAEKRNITVHQLLSHTSGLPGDLEAQGGLDRPQRPGRLRRIVEAGQRPQRAQPASGKTDYRLSRLTSSRALRVPSPGRSVVFDVLRLRREVWSAGPGRSAGGGSADLVE